jgi:hypothetical protein
MTMQWNSAMTISDTSRVLPLSYWWYENAAAAHHPHASARRSVIGMSVLALAILLGSFAARGMNAAGPSACQITLPSVALASNIETTMTVGSTPCSLWVQPGSDSFDEITMLSKPDHGIVTARGRTGVVYQANPGFKGEDFFVFVLHGGPATYKRSTVIRVRAVVG